jgi:hypothetical protein
VPAFVIPAVEGRTDRASVVDQAMTWGAARLWDNAIFRVISGGTGTAKDLSELSDLAGKHQGKPALQRRRSGPCRRAGRGAVPGFLPASPRPALRAGRARTV